MNVGIHRLRSHPVGRWLVDLGLVVVVAVAVDLQIGAAVEPGARPAWPIAFLFGPAVAALALLRRRWPLGVLVLVMVMFWAYNAVGFAGFSPIIALAVPLYATARARRLWWAIGAAALVVGVTLGFTTLQDHIPLSLAIGQVLPQAALLTTLVLLGETVRSRVALADQMRDTARHAAADRERESRRRVTEERLRIARDLHDVLAHTLAGAAVQAGVATDTLADNPTASRTALAAVRAAYRDARSELAAIVGVLRNERRGVDDVLDRAPVPGLDQLDALLRTTRAAGLVVDLAVTGKPSTLPPPVDIAAYRIVQEALTNVIQHAQAGSVIVSIEHRNDRVTIAVTDDGRRETARHPALEPADGSHGLLGMRERATALGGTVTSGPRTAGGFEVVATLPTTSVMAEA